MIEFVFQNKRFEGRDRTDPVEVLLGIVGDFAIRIDGRTLYEESEFPLVEFAREVKTWLDRVAPQQGAFRYSSAESATPDLVVIQPDSDRWAISAAHQNYKESSLFDLGDMATAIRSYVMNIEREARSAFGIDLTRVLNL